MIKPFEKNTVKTLWNDPYLSKQMLKHHLDFNSDISSRKYKTIERTVEFLIKRMKLAQGTMICDFGCGPGLYTNLLQNHGFNVTGVDFSTNSIEYARSQNPDIDYIEANYLDVKIDKKFDLITQIYCDFCALSPQDVTQLLQNVHLHLKDGGYFFFDVHNLQYFQNQEEMIYTHRENDGFYMEGPSFITETIYKYPKELVTLNHIVAKGSREVELYNWLKAYTKEEIEGILDAQGFTIIDSYESTYGENLKDSHYLAILCQKK